MYLIQLRYVIALAFYLLPVLLHGMKSSLELFPGKGKEIVTLPYAYYSPTVEEKNNLKYIPEGCFTMLDDRSSECILVGALQPCQLLVLQNDGKTIVSHLNLAADLKYLLNQAEKYFKDSDLTITTGTLFSNRFPFYDKPIVEVNGKPMSLANISQGRNQLEEVKFIKDFIISFFNIQNGNQINSHLFRSRKKDFELGQYEYAELYVLLKYQNGILNFNSVCPMAENIFADLTNIPLEKRCDAFTIERNKKANTNQFFKNLAGLLISYRKLPSIQI